MTTRQNSCLSPPKTKHLHNLPTSISIGNAEIPVKQSVKNLGFTFHRHLTMNVHVSNIARTCYIEHRRWASIRRFLTSTATASHVSAFVFSRNDSSNSMLFGPTHEVISHLYRIKNYAVRVILHITKSANITTHLISLHWIPVKVRSTYKISCLCYHCYSTSCTIISLICYEKSHHTLATPLQLTQHASSQ